MSSLAFLLTFTALVTLHFNPISAATPRFTEAGCASLPTLVCNLQPTDGFSTSGAIYFTPVWSPRAPGTSTFTCYTRVSAVVEGLTNPKHGFHVHTYGDLSLPDGASTGGHFTNPAGDLILHALPTNATRHWGDFGNLINDGSGMAKYDRVDDVIRLGGVVGRAITVHEGEDMGHSAQPSGDSGARIGYCVIGYSNPDVVKL